MTNKQIIEMAAIEAGLYTTDEMVTLLMAGEPLSLRTVRQWNAMGYTVKKGEHAAIQVRLWSAEKGTPEGDTEGFSPCKEVHFVLRPASLFTADQVVPADSKDENHGRATPAAETAEQKICIKMA